MYLAFCRSGGWWIGWLVGGWFGVWVSWFVGLSVGGLVIRRSDAIGDLSLL